MGKQGSALATAKWYVGWTFFFVFILFMGTFFLGMPVYGMEAGAFNLICSVAYILGWQALCRRSPELLPKYYLAGSAFRLMAAAMMMLVFCVVNRGNVEAIKRFAVVFIVFYLVILAFDAIFFAKVSHNKKTTK